MRISLIEYAGAKNYARDTPQRGSHFTETHWSLVLAAKAEGSSRAAEAMEKLCGIYWRPVYAYIRRQDHNSHRLRTRHREMVREEIAHTVARSEEIDEEIRNLLAALGLLRVEIQIVKE